MRDSVSRASFDGRSDSGTLGSLRESELTKLLGWPGYRVYRHEINERAKTLVKGGLKVSHLGGAKGDHWGGAKRARGAVLFCS
jgi:hypothetical protein